MTRIKIASRVAVQVLFWLSAMGLSPEWATGQVNSNADPTTSQRTGQTDSVIEEILKETMKESSLPGIVAAIAKRDAPIRVGAAGIRKFEDETPIKIDDQLHLGSCTKAITASMIARLIERGILSWDTTIKEGLPEMSEKIHPGFHEVTLKQLTMHLGGIPREAKNWYLTGDDGLTDKRTRIVVESLTSAPKQEPGSNFEYSNLGYMIAGLIAARKTGKSWEQLVQEEVFDKLDLKSAGFGPPGTVGMVDQPWGHFPLGENRFGAFQRDNPPSLGPAGTIHMSMKDWATFALEHTRTEGGDWLSADSIRELHTPNEKSKYAKGWIVLNRPWGKGTVLSHSGSNTLWMATVWVAPNTKTAYLVVTNVGGVPSTQALDGVIGKLIQADLKGD